MATNRAIVWTNNARRLKWTILEETCVESSRCTSVHSDNEEIIRSVKKGLYAEMFSNGQVFIGAGDFTFYLKHGRMIENGKLTHVVKDANLIGNGPKVLETVDMVGNDLQLFSGAGYCGKDGQRMPVGFGLPTIRCGAMSIGGRKS